MPRHRPRELPGARALREALAASGVTDAPQDGPEDACQGLLFLAGTVVERLKRVSFPGFSWDAPGFVAEDDKARVDFAFARLAGREEADVAQVIREAAARARGKTFLLALDARPSGLKEFELGHLLYGGVTLYAYPHRPAEPMDVRVHDAAEKGWGKTLKEHNLLPGRGIVVHDEDHGLFLTLDAARLVHGALVLFTDGDARLWWNPVADGGDPEMQFWFSWGAGLPASAWREVVSHGEG